MCRLDGQYLTDGSEEEEEEDVDEDDLEEWVTELAELVKVVKMQAWYHITARKLSRITQIPHTFRLE